MDKKQAGDKYIVRFPEGMRDRLHEEARKNGRSLNAEVITRLQASLEHLGAATSTLEATAYRSHALALEGQAMTLQHQLLTLMEKVKASREGEPKKALQDQIRLLERKIAEIDAMTRELHSRANAGLHGLEQDVLKHLKTAMPAAASKKASKKAA